VLLARILTNREEKHFRKKRKLLPNDVHVFFYKKPSEGPSS